MIFPVNFLSEGFSLRWEVYISQPSRSDFYEFFCGLKKISSVVVFGGVVRDFLLGDKKGFVGFDSDFDLVVDGISDKELSDFIKSVESIKIVENKFGGYRIYFSTVYADVWVASKTWAFQQGLVDFNSVSSLLQTTFFNVDSIYYDVTSEQVVTSKCFEYGVVNKILSIQLENNPNPIGSLRRAIKYSQEYGYCWDYDLVEYAKLLVDAAIVLHGAEYKIAPNFTSKKLKDELNSERSEFFVFSQQLSLGF